MKLGEGRSGEGMSVSLLELLGGSRAMTQRYGRLLNPLIGLRLARLATYTFGLHNILFLP